MAEKKKCAACAVLVKDYTLCVKCQGVFHPKCYDGARHRKKCFVPTGVADDDKLDLDARPVVAAVSDADDDLRYAELITEVKYLKEIIVHKEIIIREITDKNLLLLDKIHYLESKEQSDNNSNTKLDLPSHEVPINKQTIASQISGCTAASDGTVRGGTTKPEWHMRHRRNRNNSVRDKIPPTTDTSSKSSMNELVAENINKVNKTNNSRRHADAIVGVGSEDGNTLKAQPKRAWYYLGNCNSDVTIEDVRTYFMKKFNNVKLLVLEKLDSKGKCNSFKLATDFKHKDSIMTPTSWPNGITIRRFRYVFQENKQDGKQAENFTSAAVQANN